MNDQTQQQSTDQSNTSTEGESTSDEGQLQGAENTSATETSGESTTQAPLGIDPSAPVVEVALQFKPKEQEPAPAVKQAVKQASAPAPSSSQNVTKIEQQLVSYMDGMTPSIALDPKVGGQEGFNSVRDLFPASKVHACDVFRCQRVERTLAFHFVEIAPWKIEFHLAVRQLHDAFSELFINTRYTNCVPLTDQLGCNVVELFLDVVRKLLFHVDHDREVRVGHHVFLLLEAASTAAAISTTTATTVTPTVTAATALVTTLTLLTAVVTTTIASLLVSRWLTHSLRVKV